MWKRLAAAAVALILAAVGVLLVLAYANNADRRALEGMETESVLVAAEAIPEGTPAEELGQRVEIREVPRTYVAEGALAGPEEVEGQLTTAPIAPGEQVQRARFSTPEEIRAGGQTELPEGVENLHQVTVSLEKPRALGGNVTIGDTVGVFMSFEIEGDGEFVLGDDGTVVREEGDGEDDGSTSISTTHLTLHKVPVVRVEGGFVAPPPDGEDEEQGAAAQDTVNVTLAVEAPHAEQLVFAMEFGTVWLSLEPNAASEEDTGVVLKTVPNEGRDVYQ